MTATPTKVYGINAKCLKPRKMISSMIMWPVAVMHLYILQQSLKKMLLVEVLTRPTNVRDESMNVI